MSYFKTFSDAVDAMQLPLNDAQAILIDKEWPGAVLMSGPVSYGQTLQVHFEIMTLKGKQTRKFFHASIYRMDSGTYELTTYIL